ncbi:MAG: spermidine/putrescine ABC transporter substrate-binding protein [Trueperaceae bacterium]|nr:spermidine/putrescine ABC transporter substrate-binding protein [Trueperaceae bacterium]
MTRFAGPILACLLALLPTAVAQDDATWTCPEGFEGERLSVYNWTTYIAPDTIRNFEEACGVEVTYDTYPTDTDMVARIRQGNPGYDVVVPSDVNVYLMVEEGLVEPLDHALLPNLEHIDSTFLDLQFDPNNRYTVPYQWGTVGLGYDVNAVGHEIEGWRDMFAYDGPVSWLEDVRVMMGVGLLLLGEDPNTGDPEAIDAAKEHLIDNGDNVVYINQDDGQEVLLRGEADIVVEYSGDIFQIMEECDCDDYRYVIPEEGTNFWVDNLAIPVDAPNPELAHAFIDYVLDPQVSADIANYTAYGSPNATAIENGLIDEDLLNNPGVYPSEETQERMFEVVQDSELEQLYNDAWDEIRIRVGR